MAFSSDESLGRIEVSPQTIAAIAEEAALQCYGIVGLASRPRRSVWEALTQSAPEQGGIVVRVEGDQVSLDLYVVIEYGTRISEVARNVMSSVKFAVEQALGVPVQQVNVDVQGLHLGSSNS